MLRAQIARLLTAAGAASLSGAHGLTPAAISKLTAGLEGTPFSAVSAAHDVCATPLTLPLLAQMPGDLMQLQQPCRSFHDLHGTMKAAMRVGRVKCSGSAACSSISGLHASDLGCASLLKGLPQGQCGCIAQPPCL